MIFIHRFTIVFQSVDICSFSISTQQTMTAMTIRAVTGTTARLAFKSQLMQHPCIGSSSQPYVCRKNDYRD